MRAGWHNDSGRLLYINSLMSDEEKDIFFIDLTKIDQQENYMRTLIGLQKYMVG